MYERVVGAEGKKWNLLNALLKLRNGQSNSYIPIFPIDRREHSAFRINRGGVLMVIFYFLPLALPNPPWISIYEENQTTSVSTDAECFTHLPLDIFKNNSIVEIFDQLMDDKNHFLCHHRHLSRDWWYSPERVLHFDRFDGRTNVWQLKDSQTLFRTDRDERKLSSGFCLQTRTKIVT